MVLEGGRGESLLSPVRSLTKMGKVSSVWEVVEVVEEERERMVIVFGFGVEGAVEEGAE